jgi:hypothetical protein
LGQVFELFKELAHSAAVSIRSATLAATRRNIALPVSAALSTNRSL